MRAFALQVRPVEIYTESLPPETTAAKGLPTGETSDATSEGSETKPKPEDWAASNAEFWQHRLHQKPAAPPPPASRDTASSAADDGPTKELSEAAIATEVDVAKEGERVQVKAEPGTAMEDGAAPGAGTGGAASAPAAAAAAAAASSSPFDKLFPAAQKPAKLNGGSGDGEAGDGDDGGGGDTEGDVVMGGADLSLQSKGRAAVGAEESEIAAVYVASGGGGDDKAEEELAFCARQMLLAQARVTARNSRQGDGSGGGSASGDVGRRQAALEALDRAEESLSDILRLASDGVESISGAVFSSSEASSQTELPAFRDSVARMLSSVSLVHRSVAKNVGFLREWVLPCASSFLLTVAEQRTPAPTHAPTPSDTGTAGAKTARTLRSSRRAPRRGKRKRRCDGMLRHRR